MTDNWCQRNSQPDFSNTYHDSNSDYGNLHVHVRRHENVHAHAWNHGYGHVPHDCAHGLAPHWTGNGYALVLQIEKLVWFRE